MHSAIVSSRVPGALLFALIVAACGQDGGGTKAPTQVAAKVNGDEVTVHQVNQVLARVGDAGSKEQAATLGRAALDQLVDQQLLVQKAVELKLDRDPAVMAALDAARRQLLAQSYMEKVVVPGTPAAAPEQIEKFYVEHPELFSERRIFRLQELLVAVPPETVAALRADVEKTRNLNVVAAGLRARGIKFNANSVVQPAEQLPLRSLDVLAKMKDGDVTVLEDKGNVAIVQLVASQDAPKDRAEARPLIEQYLQTQARSARAAAEMKRLRDTAKLEYLGQFAAAPPADTAKGAAAPVTAPSAQISAPAKAAAAAPVPTAEAAPAAAGTATAAEGASTARDLAFEKGLRGLK